MDAIPQAPSVVGGKYTLKSALPTHGRSRLFSAQQADSGRLVALRQFAPTEGTLEQALEALTRAASVQSRFIAEVLDAARLNDQELFVAHPLMNGESLVARLERKKTLDVLETAVLGARLLRGLDALHTKGVTHGGLRPSRIFHERSPKRGWHIKLLGAAVPTLSRDDVRADPALLQFAPPEWLEGEPWTPAGDIWCVGAIFYLCLTGRPAHAGKTAAQVEERVRNGEASPLVVPGVSPEFEALVTSAMAREPRARPASARAFFERLTLLYPEPTRESPVAAAREHWTHGHFVGRPVPAGATNAGVRRTQSRTAIIRQQRRTVRQTALVSVLGTALVAAAIGVAWARRAPAGSAPNAAPPRVDPATAASGRAPAPASSTAPLASTGGVEPVNAAPPANAADARELPAAVGPTAAPPGVHAPHPAGNGTSSAPRVARTTRPSSGAPTPPPPVAPTGTAPSGYGRLEFSSASTCEFMLDGVARGEMTRTEMTLPIGTHRVSCGIGRRALHVTVRIDSDRITRVHANSIGDTEVSTESAPPPPTPR